MGYYMDQTDSKFVMKKENFGKALQALKGVFIPENMTCIDYVYGKKYPHFSWVDTNVVLKAKTIEEALKEIRYEPEYDNEGNIVNVEFTGEKFGDEEIFFMALAPYIEKGSYISFEGEDGCEWTWFFNGKKVKYLGGV